MTTLSILIPHYNDAEGLALTLRSIEAQTWRGDREIVVCDDGSRADQRAKLDEVLAATTERVILVENRVNRGRPYTRNVLLDNARGKYTTWCDAGDEYYPRKLELQLEAWFLARARRLLPPAEGDAVQPPHLGPVWITCASHWRWQGSPSTKLIRQDVSGDQVNNLLLGSLRGYLYTLLGTTQSFRDVGYFDLQLPRLQDLDFFLRFVSKGGRLLLPPTTEPLCIYHKSDVGRDGAEVLACNEYLFRKHAALLIARSRRYRRNRRFQQLQLAARFTHNNNDRRRTNLYLAQAALVSPMSFARWLFKSKGQL